MAEGYASKTVEDLREIARDRDLPVSGTKHELLDRLLTVEQLRDELRDIEEPVTGSKAELIERLIGADTGDAGSEKVTGASEVEAEAPAPSKEAEPKRQARNIGGHVIYVDPEPPTPDPIETCSICGQSLVDGQCPDHSGETSGWAVVPEKGTPRSRAAEGGG
jgi:hypothetical protein